MSPIIFVCIQTVKIAVALSEVCKVKVSYPDELCCVTGSWLYAECWFCCSLLFTLLLEKYQVFTDPTVVGWWGWWLQLLTVTGKMNSSASPQGENFSHDFSLGDFSCKLTSICRKGKCFAYFLLTTLFNIFFEYVFWIFLSLNAFFLVNYCLRLWFDLEFQSVGMLGWM